MANARALLKEYGTSLAALRKMDLKHRMAQPLPQMPDITEQEFPTPVIYSAAEAKRLYNLNLPAPDYSLKISQDATRPEGYRLSYMSPSGYEFLDDDTVNTPEGTNLSYDDLMKQVQAPVTVRNQVTGEPVDLTPDEYERLKQYYQQPEVIASEKAFEEAGQQGLESFREDQQKVLDIFGRVFPQQEISQLLQFADEKPDEFLNEIVKAGRTPDTDALLKRMFPDIADEELAQLFTPVQYDPIPPGNVIKPNEHPENVVLRKGGEAVTGVYNWLKQNIPFLTSDEDIKTKKKQAAEAFKQKYGFDVTKAIVSPVTGKVMMPGMDISEMVGKLGGYDTPAQLLAENVVQSVFPAAAFREPFTLAAKLLPKTVTTSRVAQITGKALDIVIGKADDARPLIQRVPEDITTEVKTLVNSPDFQQAVKNATDDVKALAKELQAGEGGMARIPKQNEFRDAAVERLTEALKNAKGDEVYISPQMTIEIGGKSRLVNTSEILNTMGVESADRLNYYKKPPTPAVKPEQYAAEYKTWVESGYKGKPPRVPEGMSSDLAERIRLDNRPSAKPAEGVKPASKPITRTTVQQDIQETAKILTTKLKENGISERDISDYLDVYGISSNADELRASLTYEQLRSLGDTDITENNIRKLTRKILSKEFGVPEHEIDLVLESGPRTNPRLDVQQAKAKAEQIDNIIKGNLPTHKQIVESIKQAKPAEGVKPTPAKGLPSGEQVKPSAVPPASEVVPEITLDQKKQALINYWTEKKIGKSIKPETWDENYITSEYYDLYGNNPPPAAPPPRRVPIWEKKTEIPVTETKPTGAPPSEKPPTTAGTATQPPEPPKVPATTTKAQPPAPRPGFAGNIRLSKFPEAVQDDIRKAAESMPEAVEAARRGTIPMKTTEQMAYDFVQMTGGDTTKLVKKVSEAYNAEEIRALGGALTSNIDEMHKLTELINTPAGNTSANLLKLAELQKRNILLQLGRHGSAAEAGRALNTFKMINNAIKANTNPAMEAVIRQLGGRKNLEGLAAVMAKVDWNNPVQVNNFMRSINQPKAMEYLNEIFVNSILSGPKTHMINLLTNMINTVMSPLERGVAAAIDRPLAAISQRNVERFFAEVPADIYGAMRGIPEGLHGAAQTMKTGLNPTALSKYEYRPSAFKGKLGRAINVPVNVLDAADNLNYNINFRSSLQAEILRAGKSQGLKEEALQNFIVDTLANPPGELIQKAANNAEYRLFRGEGGRVADVLYSIRELGFEVPKLGRVEPLKFVIPFVRTPVNIAKYGLERSPLGLFNPKLWTNLANKDPMAADQLARIFIGSTMAAGIALLFSHGRITGAAPTGAGAKDRFYREGKQPYSIKVGDKWISYQRLEPFNTDFTLVSIAVDAIENKDKSADQKILDAVSSFSKNFVSQTYMSGISDILNLMNNPDTYGSNLLESTGQAILTPASSLLRTLAQAFDTTIRQPQNFIQKMETGIPGLSRNVPARVNVFGEPSVRTTPWYSPIAISTEDDSRVFQELGKHGVNIGFTGDSINGVKLTEEQQRQYQEMAGPMVKDAVLRVINSPDYDNLSADNAKAAIESAANKAKAQARLQMTQSGQIDSSMDSLTKLKAINDRLGTVIPVTTPQTSIDRPIIYDTKKYYSDSGSLLDTVKAADVTDPLAQASIKAHGVADTIKTYPSVKLIDLNTDPNKGDTYRELYYQNLERSKITDPLILKEFDANPYTANAYQGNFSRRQMELLDQYFTLTTNEDKAQFLKDNPDLDISPRDQWLISHPTENAQLAIFGQAKVLTQAAYDKARAMVKELDIPENAIKDYLPPDDVAKPYFDYQEAVSKWSANSAEAMLLRAKNPKLEDYLGLDTTDKNVQALEIQVKNRDLNDLYKSYSDPDSENFKDDKVKNADGKTARDLAYAQFRKQNTGWVDDNRTIEVLSKGGDATTAKKWVERGKVADQYDSASSEAKAWLIDNPNVHKWAVENKLLEDDGSDWNEKVIRIDVKWRKQDTEYDAIQNPDERVQRQLRAEYLAKNIDYKKARIERDGYQLGIPTDTGVITQWNEFYELPEYGYYRKRYQLENPHFFQTVTGLQQKKGMAVWETPDPAKVPAKEYDEIYEKWQSMYDRLDAISKAPGTEAERKARRDAIMQDPANADFVRDNYRREAYGLMFPQEYVEGYAEYYTLSTKGYVQERYLQANPGLYREMKTRLGWKNDIDFSKVPSNKVEYLLGIYDSLPTSGGQREAFRRGNPDLDTYLVRVNGLKPLSTLSGKKLSTASTNIMNTSSKEAQMNKLRQLAGVR